MAVYTCLKFDLVLGFPLYAGRNRWLMHATSHLIRFYCGKIFLFQKNSINMFNELANFRHSETKRVILYADAPDNAVS